jgi:hypothetical protein
MAKRVVIREAPDDFAAYKIAEACAKSGGDVVSVTVSPQVEFDHLRGHQVPTRDGRLRWIVWMVFDAAFNPDVLDAAIRAEDGDEA